MVAHVIQSHWFEIICCGYAACLHPEEALDEPWQASWKTLSSHIVEELGHLNKECHTTNELLKEAEASALRTPISNCSSHGHKGRMTKGKTKTVDYQLLANRKWRYGNKSMSVPPSIANDNNESVCIVFTSDAIYNYFWTIPSQDYLCHCYQRWRFFSPMFGLKTHARRISVVELLLHSHYLIHKAITWA